MTIRLVGAGLPRTGTTSLREALTRLLGAPTYHMSTALRRPEHAPTWVAAIHGDPPDWDELLTGYAAGVDAPFSTCWRQLAAAYPDAPVLLSRRESAEVWLRSMEPTVLTRTREVLAHGDPADPVTALFGAIFHGIVDDLADLDDPTALLAAYERHDAAVRATIPAERLVEWHPGDGWEPLCRALGVPVPDEPFPHENSTVDYLRRAEERRRTGT
ncbi:sulfotransferase family protein [Nocardioides solisilvae]|uniref:sulfotransferase family protein n=1 Tax=Nocardioides solisilvae TaxID=1542435 RepID=UPI000D74902B|nr:sulfotransferase family protein [Nocardioides solisilvae]